MLSVQKKFLFIHIPKTGGNSIQNILSKYSEDGLTCEGDFQDGVERFGVSNKDYPSLKKHSTLMAYKHVLDRHLFNSLYKFAVIRNPWERMVSYYFSPHRGVDSWDRDDFIGMLNNEVAPARDFLRISNRLDNYLGRLGLGKIVPAKPLDYNIDYMLKMETLQSDFNHVCDMINIPHEILPIRNKSGRADYTIYYDGELKSLVESKFIDEIRFGEYEF